MQLVKINEVAKMLRCSVPTIRRRLAEARRGERLFPLPLNQPNCQNVWRLEDIENWSENPVTETRKMTKQQRVSQRKSEVIGLSRHGIHID